MSRKGDMIKRIAIAGKNKEHVANVKETLAENGFLIVKSAPDVVLCLGGDGTFLYAERMFPTVPKLLIRDSNICKKCNVDLLTEVFQQLKSRKAGIVEHMKLSARIVRKGKTVAERECANDVVLRNRHLPEAIRFSVQIDDTIIDGECIGDGIVISTPFGSTAYFYSITRRTFRKGIGIALNNTTKQVGPIVASPDSTVRIRLLRRDADFASDNDPNILHLQQGDIIEIKKSKAPVRIIKIKRPRMKLLQWMQKRWRRRQSM